jgi:predicted nuclease with TOPRIM domain
MQEIKVKQQRNRKEDRERLEQIIGQSEKDVETGEDRASKLAVNFSNLETKTEHSIAEVKRNIQRVEQLISEARVSYAAV